MASPETLIEDLAALVGPASLRCVATYTGTERDIHYIRDDVNPHTGSEGVDRIHEELVLADIGGGYQERLFDLGALRATARHFEEGVVVQVPGEAYTGVFVSVDRGAGGEASGVIDACRSYLRRRDSGDRPLLRGSRVARGR